VSGAEAAPLFFTFKHLPVAFFPEFPGFILIQFSSHLSARAAIHDCRPLAFL
jgi:hypothetical protein